MLRLDFVSDIACPWCAVGLHSLDIALGRLGPEIAVALHVQPFELNPSMAPEGADAAAYLKAKYGMDDARLAHNRQVLHERGAAVGFVFGPRARVWNTFDAHRLLHWAGLPEQPAGAQHRLKRGLLQAYHGAGENPGDAAVLRRQAEAAGLDGEQAAAGLAQGWWADEVRAAEQEWLAAGIQSVPALVINRRHLVSGGQPPEVFEAALRELAAAA